MTQYGGCRVVVEFDDGRATHEDDDADVQLEAAPAPGASEPSAPSTDAMLVSYWDDQGPVVMAGARDEQGRFALTGRSRPRTALLRREGPRSFVGTWSEGGAGGTLRVELPEAPQGEGG